MRKLFLLLAASACLSLPCLAQDQSTSDQQASAPAASLGDIARQMKLKKQQKQAQLQQAKASQPVTEIQNAGQAQEVKAAHIVTNDDSSEHASVTPAVEQATTSASDSQTGHEDRNAKAGKWKSDILAQKSQIASMEQEMKALSDSIHYAGGNCIANCAQWNEKQQEKQQQVESMKGQLQELQKHLEEMQESARKEGFGSTVSDPSE